MFPKFRWLSAMSSGNVHDNHDMSLLLVHPIEKALPGREVVQSLIPSPIHIDLKYIPICGVYLYVLLSCFSSCMKYSQAMIFWGCLIVCPLVVKHGLLENSKFIDNFPIKTPFRVDFPWFSSFSCLMTPFRVRRTTWNHPHLQGQGLAQGICEFDCSILLNVWWRLRQLELAMWAMEQTQWTYHGKWWKMGRMGLSWIFMDYHAHSCTIMDWMILEIHGRHHVPPNPRGLLKIG
jgi:hypothetical protein